MTWFIAEGYGKTEAIKGKNKMGCVVGEGRPQRWFVGGSEGQSTCKHPEIRIDPRGVSNLEACVLPVRLDATMIDSGAGSIPQALVPLKWVSS